MSQTRFAGVGIGSHACHGRFSVPAGLTSSKWDGGRALACARGHADSFGFHSPERVERAEAKFGNDIKAR
jgi:hypothetical protein